MKRCGIILSFLICVSNTYGQQDSTVKNKADRLMGADYKKACELYQQYIIKAAKSKITQPFDMLAVYDSVYVAALLLGNYQEAGKYVTSSFELSRKLNIAGEVSNRLIKVVDFYLMAQSFDWPLLPRITDYNARSLIFPVTSVKYFAKDSAILTIKGGAVEGLYVGLEVDGLGTKLPFLEVDRSSNLLGRGKITSVKDNSAVILFSQTYTTDSADNIYPKDVVMCEVNAVYKKELGDYLFLADKAISFTNNSREQPYHIRQLAFYNIPGQQFLLDTIFLNSVLEIAEMFQDTTIANRYIKTMPSGFFKDMSFAEALAKTRIHHIRAFLKYVKKYPGKYYGQKFKFSEVYATWLINSSPLDETGLLELLEEYKGIPFYQECLKVYDSIITTGKQWLVWKDIFLDSLDNGKILPVTWEVLQNTVDYYKMPWMLAWRKLLEGRIAALHKKPADAAGLISESKKMFEQLKMHDEALYAANSLIRVGNQRLAKVALQSNHSLPFSVTFSPDGKYFATYGDDYMIKIWDSKLVKQIETISAHTNTINQVTFTPNSRFFISASNDGYIKVWDTRSQHLFKKINTGYRVKYAALNKIGDKIIAAGSDSSIHIYNFENTLEEKRYVIHKAAINTGDYNPINQQFIYTGGSDSLSYIVNLETGKWLRWFKSGGKVASVRASEDKRFFAALANNDQLYLWQQTGKFLGTFPTTKYNYSTTPIIPGFDINARKKIIAFVSDTKQLAIGILDSLRYYNYNLKFEGEILDIKIHPNGNSLLLTTTLGKLYMVNLGPFYTAHGSSIHLKMIGTNANIITSLEFSGDDNMLAFQSGSTYIMDLATGKNISLGEEGFSQLKGNITFTHHDSALIYVPSDARRLQEKNIYSGDTISALFPAVEGVYAPDDLNDLSNYSRMGIAHNVVSPDKKYAAIWFNKKSINIYDRAQNKLVHQVLLDSNQTQLITAMFIAGTNKFVVCNDVNNSVTFYEMKEKILKPLSRFTLSKGYQFGWVGYDRVKKRLIAPCQNNNIYIFDGESGKLKDSVDFNFIDKEEGVNIVRVHPDGHTLFIGLNYRMIIYDLDIKKVVYNFNNSNNTGEAAAFSHDGKMLAVGSFRGMIYLYDTREYRNVLQVQTFSNRDPVWITHDNFYIANRSSLQDLYFNYNHTLYPFDQFDINFNRPDTVLERLGRSDRSLIKAYKEAWVKRFKKSGIPAERLRPDFKVPELTILNAEEIPSFITQSPAVPLQLHMKDDNIKLASYNLWVNGVPLYGKAGKQLPASKEVTLNDTVLLSGISNVIQVSCKNEFGVESLKEKFEIRNYAMDSTRFKTYLFCLSVSDYKDKNYNLKYARKDGRDLVNAFKEEYGNNIYIDTLFDEKATLKNIMAWKKIMEKSAVKDRVILYVSGHGLLDKNYDFYYATYDVDFKNPREKGLAYDEIEKLLDKIPARRKLLLMDACHSGEVDKEGIAARLPENTLALNDAKKINVVFRSKGVGEDISNAKLGLNNSFELMQELFTNLNNGNGTAVISAAAGNSYAYESDVWNNGIFTYCLLHGLKDKAADTDRDQKVSIAELQKFVSNEVQRLTKGAQKPTARQENLENDWLIW